MIFWTEHGLEAATVKLPVLVLPNVMNVIAHVEFHSVTRPKICRGTKEIDLLDVRSNFVTRFVVESWDRGVRYVLATWWLVLWIKRLN